MAKIGLFYGTQTGTTETAAELIQKEFGGSSVLEIHNIADASVKDFDDYECIVIGCPTWSFGELQSDWEGFYDELDAISFVGKKVAYFGAGDQIGYADNFQDAMGILEEKITALGGTTVGYWPTDGYEHNESKAVKNGNFVGLAIDVPPAIVGDPFRLRQVLLNLLSNAVKFTETGSIQVRVVRVSAQLVFEVVDTGIGIGAEEQAQLFEPFVQAGAATPRRYGGTGLGLAICRELVMLMGGEIGLTSAVGQGTRFWFTVPVVETASPPVAPASGVGVVRGLPRVVVSPAPRILVAEDELINREVIVRQLQQLGYMAVGVANGEATLTVLSAQPFDLLLLDCQMPVRDGYETAAAIRTQEQLTGQHLPIVALTANAQPHDRERCLAAGMDDYLKKPFLLLDLANLLAQWLPGTTACETPIDQHTLAENLGADRAIQRRYLELFVQAIRTDLQTLQHYLATENLAGIVRLCHRLQGSCATARALPLQATIAGIGQLARASRTAELPVLLNRLEAQLQEVSQWLAVQYPPSE